MADNSVLQTIKDAEIDARSLSEFIYKPADFVVGRRLAPSIHTLEYYLDLIKKAIQSTGYNIVGSFKYGATLNNYNDVIKDENGQIYRWGGSLPKTVPRDSTPESTGGHGKNTWVLVDNRSAKTVTEFRNAAFLPALDSPQNSGLYSVVNAPDTPFDGLADVTIYLKGGKTYGKVTLTDTSLTPSVVSTATLNDGVWSDWSESPSFEDGYAVPVSKSDKFVIADGGYSWWNEPQSCQLSNITPRIAVGSVNKDGGSLVTVNSSAQMPIIKNTFLQPASKYIPDEHNAPVARLVNGKLVVFYPGHNDKGYLGYRVSSDATVENFGDEIQIPCPKNNVSYSQVMYSKYTKKLYVMFRAGGQYGTVNAWYLAESVNWDADKPAWTVNMLFEDTEQMYCLASMTGSGITIRVLLTKNARYEDINGLWYASIDLRNGSISTTTGVVGNMQDGSDALLFKDLTKIYSVNQGRIRLYDMYFRGTGAICILVSVMQHEDPNTVYDDAGIYRFLYFPVSDGEVTRERDIVSTGRSLKTNYYYGGVHFSNPLAVDGGQDIGSIYLSREENDVWYLEQYDTSDAGVSWSKTRVIDTAKMPEKIWRPRVPFGTRELSGVPNLITLTWIKGTWSGYQASQYDAKMWALRE